MKAYFGRRYRLSASHRLNSEALSPEENRAAYGKCNNPHGHGHNYLIEALVGGEVDPETGMVVNLADLDAVVKATILERFDHTNLNLDPLFVNLVPTTENLCRAVFQLLGRVVPAGRLASVRVEETENNFFQCTAEDDSGRMRAFQ
jgi:6-pyruvoyltetrahydropterin/6-carboxytetrahydropterin synthase